MVDLSTHHVRLAYLKLRVEMLARHPEILERIDMEKRPPLKIPLPVELAGMRARLLRSQEQEKDITKTGKDYDEVMDRIDELRDAHKGHVEGLTAVESKLRDTILRMTERSNADPTDGESDGRQSSSDTEVKQPGAQADITTVTVPGLKPDATKADTAPAPPASPDGGATEQLTVNGVTKQS